MQHSIDQALKLHQSGQLDQALEAYLALFQHHPWPDVAGLIGIIYAQKQQYKLAISYFTKELKQNPNSIATLNNCAKAHYYLKQNEDAHRLMKQSLLIQHHQPSGHVLMAKLLGESNPEMALGHLSTALQQDPSRNDAFLLRAQHYIHRQEWDKAKKDLHRAHDCDPKDIPTLKQLGQFHMSQNCFDQAIQVFEQVSSMIDDADVEHWLGTLYLRQDNEEKALESFRNCLLLNPKHPELHHNLAGFFLTRDNHHEAIKHWMSHLECHPKDAETYFNIGVAYSYLNQFQNAHHYLAEALSIDPKMLSAHINLAAVYLQNQNIKQAIIHYQEALNIKQDQPDIQYILSALKGQPTKPSDQVPEQYTKQLFNRYAHYYDHHLLKVLDYQVPKQLNGLLTEYAPKDANIIDVGCGTGINGSYIKPFAAKLIGIDLAPNMIEYAEKTKLYDELHVNNILTFKSDEPFNVAILADVLPYVGDLSPLFQQLNQLLKTHGIVIFTAEKSLKRPWQRNQHARCQHHEDYITSTLQENHFNILEQSTINLRKQMNDTVKGWLFCAQKANHSLS
ncbi:MAG: tetratricopeptide repeat protein [Candidatus Comchoanobacterales bacterium]